MWNYRVIKFEEKELVSFQICEVYYEHDVPTFYCNATIQWNDDEHPENVMAMMARALEEEVLPAEIFKGMLDKR